MKPREKDGGGPRFFTGESDSDTESEEPAPDRGEHFPGLDNLTDGRDRSKQILYFKLVLGDLQCKK